MDNFINSNFSSEADWQSTSTPIVKTFDGEEFQGSDEEKVLLKTKKRSKHPVLTVQLTVVLVGLLLIFALKFLSEPLYSTVISWYQKEISKSIIYNGNFESFDFSEIFATKDEA